MEWHSITSSIIRFKNLPKTNPLSTLITHPPLIIASVLMLVSDLQDGKIRIRSSLKQVGPENMWFYVAIATYAIIAIYGTYRALTALEAIKKK